MLHCFWSRNWIVIGCTNFAALLLCAWLLSAQAQCRFDHWTAGNGLPQSSVRDIVQTHNGYLWLATFDGQVRFDGVRFTVFSQAAYCSDVTVEAR